MGVYIKGEITKEHLMGILEIYELEFTGGNDNRLVDVPYPHGRLIDADFEEAHYTSMTTKPTPDVSQKDKENSLIIVKALQMARTVIEREDE